MNYFEKGIMNREREMEYGQPSVCITRQMTDEEKYALSKLKTKKLESMKNREADEYICRRADDEFRKKCRKVKRTI